MLSLSPLFSCTTLYTSEILPMKSFSGPCTMGESDDEYDRKRRDKFRGERTERSTAEFRGGGGGDRRGPSRDDWQDKWVLSPMKTNFDLFFVRSRSARLLGEKWTRETSLSSTLTRPSVWKKGPTFNTSNKHDVFRTRICSVITRFIGLTDLLFE